jgi:hypothetical protein
MSVNLLKFISQQSHNRNCYPTAPSSAQTPRTAYLRYHIPDDGQKLVLIKLGVALVLNSPKTDFI